MPNLHLLISSDPHHLLEAAADGFLTPLEATDDNPFPTPPYLLALRQGGLRDDLIRLAAERGVKGWFDPPLAIFHELPEWLGRTEREPLGDYERLVLLGAVLQQAAGDVLGRIHRVGAFVDAIDRLFGELVSEGVTSEQFGNAASQRKGDEFELGRDGELAAVYATYLDTLDKHSMRDGRDTNVDCANAVKSDAAALAERLGTRREVRIFGLHDLRGGWRTLLDALCMSPALDRVLVYAADESLLGEGLEGTVEQLDCQPRFDAALFTDAESNGDPVGLIAASDVDREIEEVARRVRELADQGTPLHRIGVVSRKARPYLDLAIDALTRVGVPVSARRRVSFAEIPVVRSVLALFQAAADGWTRRALVNLTAQPYYANALDVRVLNYLGYREAIAGLDQWVTALSALEQEARRAESGDDDDEDRRRKRLPKSSRVQQTREAVEDFAGHVRALDQSRPLLDWVTWLDAFLKQDPLGIDAAMYAVPGERYEIARTDLAGWRGLTGVVGQWHDALERWGTDNTRIDAAQFRERLAEVLSGDAALWLPTRRGVQVLEGMAAAYRPFDHVFVVGMEAGRFPSLPPRSPIIGDTDRTALREVGLPLEESSVWEARERSLFRILAAGAQQSLTLSYVNLDTLGELKAPSAFVEAAEVCHGVDLFEIPPHRVLTPDVPVYGTAAAAEQAAHAAQVERTRQTGALTPYTGLIKDPQLLAKLAQRYGDDYLWSPSQLEKYAQCPWGWFSGRVLKLEKLDDPDQEMDAATRGRVLHDALARFYDAATKRKGGPVFLQETDNEWIGALIDTAIDEAIEAERAEGWIGHPTLEPAKRAELLRYVRGYIEWEIALHGDMYSTSLRKAPAMVRTAVLGHELAFNDVVLERGGVKVRYRGRIDRVEIGCDERFDSSNYMAAVDYKTTVSSTPGEGQSKAWDDGIVLQIPLYAHALQQLHPTAKIARVEYRAVKTPQEVHRLQFWDKLKGGLKDNTKCQRRYDAALDAVPLYVTLVRSGKFAHEPPPTATCPPWCHGADICRAKQESSRRGRRR